MIVVIDERVLIRECLAKCLATMRGNHAVFTFESVAAWQEAASRYPQVGLIVLCSQGRSHADTAITRDLMLLSSAAKSVPIILVSDADELDQVLEALRKGARGYIPTSVTLDIAIEAMHLVEAGGTFVPADSLIAFKHAEGAGTMKKEAGHNLFTARQAEVVQGIRRGKANKQIAYELNMRESTVKVNIRNIMKKLNARNRTEAAMLASNLLVRRDRDD